MTYGGEEEEEEVWEEYEGKPVVEARGVGVEEEEDEEWTPVGVVVEVGP